MSEKLTLSQSASQVSSSAVDNTPCRLCDGTAIVAFKLCLIGKYEVCFYVCDACGSLQSEDPYWLAEAYANSNLAALDTGAVQRNLNNLAAVYAWAGLSGSQSVIDVGGGDGLLCRLLRDYGVDARPEDRYAVNSYAQGFTADPLQPPIVYTAFEVLEHYANPKVDLEMLFANRPDSIVVTTALYDGQSDDWWYLTPDTGQHVFFYSRRAMELVAERFGYSIRFLGTYTIFVRGRQLGAFKMTLARLAMSRIGTRLLRSLIMLLPTRGVLLDFERMAGRTMR